MGQLASVRARKITDKLFKEAFDRHIKPLIPEGLMLPPNDNTGFYYNLNRNIGPDDHIVWLNENRFCFITVGIRNASNPLSRYADPAGDGVCYFADLYSADNCSGLMARTEIPWMNGHVVPILGNAIDGYKAFIEKHWYTHRPNL